MTKGKEKVPIEWLSYFCNQRIETQNAIIGVWISFVFGFVSIITADVMTRTLLAVVAFTIIILVVTSFFYNKYRFYEVWEIKARSAKIKKQDLERYERKKLPCGEKISNLQRITRFVAPNVPVLLIQCFIWASFLIMLLFWSPLSEQPDNMVMKLRQLIPLKNREIRCEFQLITFGERHVIFLLTAIYSFLASCFAFIITFVRSGEKQEEGCGDEEENDK